MQTLQISLDLLCLKRIGGTLALLLLVLPLAGQEKASIEGTVVDAHGAPIADAQVYDTAGRLLATSQTDGSFAIPKSTDNIEIVAPHFLPATVSIQPKVPLHVVLEHPLENVIVTAYRSPIGSMDSPASTRVMTSTQLRQAAPSALDGKLRETPGFELFRRSSSLVANPTTEGVSLRGLGSTAASRSLVVFDDVPLNDAYGGWIHWEELPELDLQSVEIVRGGASDLYGSSAIGGVISLEPRKPASKTLDISTSGGSESLTDDAVLGGFMAGPWAALATGGAIATDGYTLVAPDMRGPIDQPSNVHVQNALVEIDREFHSQGRIFLRGSGYNDKRHNGTPLQANGVRLWRYTAGADWGRAVLRLYGDTEHYGQTFSSIASNRASETLTRFGEDPADELGAALHLHQTVGSNLLLLAGADTHDVRASDDERLFTGGGSTLSTTARQRQTGVYGEALFTPGAWTISGSTRVDHFSNFDAVQFTSGSAPKLEPSLSETVFDPRLGITRHITSSFAVNASAFRAYRAPTENELYRTGQVGQQTTLPNPLLRSERATGWETGFETSMARYGSTLRASYFWTQVNRPITALTLSVTPTSELLQRENLGQIESRGISLDYAMQPLEWLNVEGGYQFADAAVTKFAQEPDLVGKWIPQVARNMATAQVRLGDPRHGTLSFQGRMSGRQFDDDANAHLLHSYFLLDTYASHAIGNRFEAFASGENLFDRAIQVGKTPVLTLGTPRLVRIGLRIRLGE